MLKLELIFLILQGVSFLNEPLRYDVQGALEYNVTDLQPDTHYQIQVAALTRKGDGDRSTPVYIKTPGGVPIKPVINLKFVFALNRHVYFNA